MAEADRYMFDFKEIAEALIQKQGIREGLWGIAIEFGLAATNVPVGPDQGEGPVISPAAISIVQKIGLQRFPTANNLTVDASTVQPKASVSSSVSKRRAKK